MAQTSARKLDDQDPFPSLTIEMVGGGQLHIPEDLDGKWSVIIAYRGLF